MRDNLTREYDTEHLKFLDIMPRYSERSADDAIVEAARTSYGNGLKTPQEDRKLIRYLFRKKHTSPFEMVELKFWVSMPIFVARQWVRHRTASINEYSGRYAEMPDKFWYPESVRKQSSVNKQSSHGSLDAPFYTEWMKKQADYEGYKKSLAEGVCREQARAGLPLSTYTQWVWKIDLHNLFNFLRLRMAPEAQQEIREYAQTIFYMVNHACPWAAEAFLDYAVNSITFYGPELRGDELTDSEKGEYKKKLEMLNETLRT